MWKKCKNAVIEIFFPKKCFFCQKHGTLLCKDCQTLIDIAPIHCPDRKNNMLDDIYSAGSYDNEFLKKMIHAFKYEPFLRSLYLPLSELIVGHFILSQDHPDRQAILIPVPLSQKRLRWRGYNQARLLADGLGQYWNIPVSADALIKPVHTLNQADLSGTERKKNIKGAFTCPDNSGIKNRTVYLIDDVVTTGATMDECAKVLKQNGASKVIGIAIARAEK